MARHSRSPVAAPTPRSAFLGASFSNTIATVLLYPLMLAKTRLQVHHNRVQGSNNQLVGLLTIWKTSIAEDGWKGLYQGLEAQILKGFINQGITMMVKQRQVAYSLLLIGRLHIFTHTPRIELLVVAIYLQYHVRGR